MTRDSGISWQASVEKNQRSAAACFRYAQSCLDLMPRQRTKRQRQAMARLWTTAMKNHARYARDARCLLLEWLGE